jgi:hypothetical protein
MTEEAEALRIYIDYDYLAAEQLAELLFRVHEIYSDILYSETPHLRQLPTAPQARLRVDTINTGGSVTVYLVQGITQVVASSDPTLVGVTTDVVALAATGTIILRVLSRWLDVRAKWRRGDRENEARRIENEAGRIELSSRSLDVESKRLDLLRKGLELRAHAEAQIHEHQEIIQQAVDEQLPELSPQQRDGLASQLAPHLEALARLASEDNIRQISITPPDDPVE